MDNDTSIWSEEYGSPLFQPDPSDPAAYLETVGVGRSSEAEKKLMFAVLKDAVECFQKNVAVKAGRRKELFAAAEAWIDEESDWPFSFANICDALGMDPRHMREGLRRWKKAKMERCRKSRRTGVSSESLAALSTRKRRSFALFAARARIG